MRDKIAGCLYGMAFGDSLGWDTEFLSVKGILENFPPNGPTDLKGTPARVTDDTQMALAVGEALMEIAPPYTRDKFDAPLQKHFIKWYHDPDNNRAPGMTCLGSLENLIDRGDQNWVLATNINSKGCGANMRVQPVGLIEADETTRAGLAQFQAAMTHAHPTGLAAADLTAWVIYDLLHGGAVETLPQRVRAYAVSQREVYHADWLGDLYKRAYHFADEKAYIQHGWDECLGILDRLDAALTVMDREADPCLATGAGWIAEEAFGTALLCFLMYPDDPFKTIQRGAVTSGDSDSIACIAGAFVGAHNDISAWPAGWTKRIEYQDRIETLIAHFAGQ